MTMTRKITQAGLLIALALLFSYMEAMLPLNFGFPGLKLGLANLVIITALYFLSLKQVLAITVLRILFAGFFSGNLLGLCFSLAGGLCSLLVMYLCYCCQGFSPLGISMAGGVTHNLAQLMVAMALLQIPSLLSLLPILLLAGLLTGLMNGVISLAIIKTLQGSKLAS